MMPFYSCVVVLYPKDTEKWKQFTTDGGIHRVNSALFCIPKILKNESNSQQYFAASKPVNSCFVSQRYWKMKAIHNMLTKKGWKKIVVLYPKDTEKWKQFTTTFFLLSFCLKLFCIPKILKNESNSQLISSRCQHQKSCFVSQRYWKMKAIHNNLVYDRRRNWVVLYPKDTEKWKQFTTAERGNAHDFLLFCIPKILKNESNSQQALNLELTRKSCFVSQRYWKMKAIHNDDLSDAYKMKLFCIPKILKNESNSQL